MLSLLMVMEQNGVEKEPGPLPEVKVTGHVIPMKSPPAPAVVRKVEIYYIHSAVAISMVASLN